MSRYQTTQEIKNDLINFLSALEKFDNYFTFSISKIDEFLNNTSNYYIQEKGLQDST